MRFTFTEVRSRTSGVTGIFVLSSSTAKKENSEL